MNLLNLMGQAAGAFAGMNGEEEDQDAVNERFARDGIQVQATPRNPQEVDPMLADDIPVRTPKSVMSDRSHLTPPTRDQMKEIVPRKGAFGVKGTLRDILGYLGDGLLLAGGEKATYMPQRAKEKQADALFGMTGGPRDQREAIERYTQLNPEGGAEMYDKYQTQDYRQSVVEGQNAGRKSLDEDRDFTNIGQAVTSLQRIIGSGKTPEHRRALLGRYGPLLATRAGVTPEELGSFENMTDEDIDAFANGDITRYQQEQLPMRAATVNQGERRVKVAEDTFEAKKEGGMFNRPPPRPPAARQPRSRTDQEAFFDIGNKPEGQRTQAEKDFYNRYINGTGRGTRGSNRRPVNPSKTINGRKFSIPPQ